METFATMSYTAAEIEAWCNDNPDNKYAKEIKKEYFTKNGNRPNEKVYYFIETFPKVQLVRDFEKSPRRYRSKNYRQRY